jgi:hypothetical protein
VNVVRVVPDVVVPSSAPHSMGGWVGLDHGDGEAAREVREVPGDLRAGFEPATGAAGGEVARELVGVRHRLVDLGDRTRDARGHGERELGQGVVG